MTRDEFKEFALRELAKITVEFVDLEDGGLKIQYKLNSGGDPGRNCGMALSFHKEGMTYVSESQMIQNFKIVSRKVFAHALEREYWGTEEIEWTVTSKTSETTSPVGEQSE